MTGKAHAADYWRQLDIVTPDDLRFPVTLIGAGGIGSPTALALAKMGLGTLTIWDHDTVDNHNVPSTMYRLSDVGKKKGDALKALIGDFTDCAVSVETSKFVAQSLSGVVISGVDNMTARWNIWEKIRWNPAVPLYIEGRMAAQVFRIHAVRPCDPGDVRWYEATMPQGKAALAEADSKEEPCTNRAIIYNTFGIAAVIASQVKKFAKGDSLFKEVIFDFENLEIYKK